MGMGKLTLSFQTHIITIWRWYRVLLTLIRPCETMLVLRRDVLPESELWRLTTLHPYGEW